MAIKVEILNKDELMRVLGGDGSETIQLEKTSKWVDLGKQKPVATPFDVAKEHAFDSFAKMVRRNRGVDLR